MKNKLVLSFVGQDRPGLIQSITTVITSHEGNWLESHMSQLAGMFAGIVLVEVEDEKVPGLCQGLAEISGVSVVIEEVVAAGPALRTRLLGLNIVGPDRRGILQEVTFELARNVANIKEMETHIAAAPMTGELTFSADALIEVPDTVDIEHLGAALDDIANRLGVDILLEEDVDD